MPTINNENNKDLENQKLNLSKQSKLDELKLEMSKLLSHINKKTHKMEESIWVVDRFEENYAICENRRTKEKIEIEIEKLPQNIREGSVLKFKDNKYELDLEEEKNIEKQIEEKMKNIWND